VITTHYDQVHSAVYVVSLLTYIVIVLVLCGRSLPWRCNRKYGLSLPPVIIYVCVARATEYPSPPPPPHTHTLLPLQCRLRGGGLDCSQEMPLKDDLEVQQTFVRTYVGGRHQCTTNIVVSISGESLTFQP
jgi:hypothetical protein